ncbi:hypothetical protein GOEFS_106_00060 [Gordonia effusa NBRC 100432]|uniref:SRPBCC family protein n=1 Tax=Gordonia effusa NBRC 100432 TaxID=1077974 RepID=H0R4V9_9ACTN|nr:SRPBCC family protein [Gordonia effusa]GAB20110.1 hypothetical protein GOEFS_106_00060 [Gordonia effusa NBRC 100432]
MPFRPEEVDASSDFYQNAPIVARGHAEFPVPAERLWELVESFEWMPVISAKWQNSEPNGPGARRRLSLGPFLLSNEFVTRYEKNKELAFYIGEVPVPGARAIAEKLEVEDLGPQRSALTYTFALAPKFFPNVQLHLVNAIAAPIFSLVVKIGWTFGLWRTR